MFNSVVWRNTSNDAIASGSTNASLAKPHIPSALLGMPARFARRYAS
jgi:hypothetical protein